MSNLNTNSWWGAVIFAALCFWGLTLHVAAANKTSPDENGAVPTSVPHQVTFQRSPDNACTQCHKDEENKLSGIHGDAINLKTGRDITCVDCHTSITPTHRDGAKDVVKFDHAQSVKGIDVPAAYLDFISQQNESCESCHEPVELREANWTHDVHARDLSCASCHAVHPSKDPMKGITRKAKIQTCVDCHSDQLKAWEKEQ